VSFPYFISPEQAMRERSELARKGIARGRSVVAMAYAGGVLFVAENPSRSLQKVSELYDRVGFAAVGRFNEFDNLRRHPRLRLRPPRCDRPPAGQRLRADPRHDLHRAGQALRG
jgi:proteasome alpha subunit